MNWLKQSLAIVSLATFATLSAWDTTFYNNATEPMDISLHFSGTCSKGHGNSVPPGSTYKHTIGCCLEGFYYGPAGKDNPYIDFNGPQCWDHSYVVYQDAQGNWHYS